MHVEKKDGEKQLVFGLGRVISGERLQVVMRKPTRDRLHDKCFRGTHIVKAGNFHRWSSFATLMDDLESQIQEECNEAIRERIRRGYVAPYVVSATESFEIECDEYVGWASTAPIDNFEASVLEYFAPSKRSVGVRVKADCRVLAPRTTHLTLVCEIRHESEHKQWTVVVHSIYPGRDIGELTGDVSQREGIAFFSWEHPGEE